MRVDELMRSLLRRPLALVLIVALAAAGAYVGWNRASSSYQSSATVLVVPPADPASSEDNPFTRLDFSSAQVALIVARQLASDAVRDQVVAVGGDPGYTTDTLSGDNSATAQLTPQVTVTATGATAAGARGAVQVLVKSAESQLAAVQSASDVPVEAQAQIVVSSPPSEASIVGNPQLRSAGVFGIAAGFLGLLLLVALLPFLSRRADRAAAAPTARRPVPEARPVADARPGRFAPVAAPAPAPAREQSGPDLSTAPTPANRRRQETLRQMVRDEWQRSGSNVPWTRREQREAYQRAEERLAEKERRRRVKEAENVSRLDDFFEYRDHG